MCFTINLNTTREAIEKRFKADASILTDFDFRYFFRAFDNPVLPVITSDNPEVVQLMQWGLIPGWTGDQNQAEKIRRGTYNARAETLHEKPSFRNAFNKRHCIIPVCGFFEWQRLGGRKIPWYIHDRESSFIVLAGMYDHWSNPVNERIIHTFSVITVPANPLMEKIHNNKKRMPAILYDSSEKQWLDSNETDRKKLLAPCNESRLNAYTVSSLISDRSANPHNQKVIEPYQYHLNGKLF